MIEEIKYKITAESILDIVGPDDATRRRGGIAETSVMMTAKKMFGVVNDDGKLVSNVFDEVHRFDNEWFFCRNHVTVADKPAYITSFIRYNGDQMPQFVNTINGKHTSTGEIMPKHFSIEGYYMFGYITEDVTRYRLIRLGSDNKHTIVTGYMNMIYDIGGLITCEGFNGADIIIIDPNGFKVILQQEGK